MPTAPLPADENQRLAALRALNILDTEYEERFDRITRLAQRIFDTEIAAVTLVDEDRQWFKSRQGPLDPEGPRSESLCAWAILEPGNPMVVGDASQDERLFDNPAVTGGVEARFYAGHPISSPDGATIGTLCVTDPRPREVAEVDVDSLRDLAQMVQSEIAALSLSISDPLTGLANRRGFEMLGERLFDVARRVDMPMAVIYADLDNLKPINDIQGHDAGDRALIEAASLLQETLRGSDLVARLGGDEYCALLTGVAAEDVGVAVDRLEDAIAERNRNGDNSFVLSMSIGIATGRPGRGDSLESLLDQADAEMYRVKRARKAAA